MSPSAGAEAVRIALLPWGTPLEVFLDPLGKTLDDFCEQLSGGWLFGYADALRAAGHRPEIVVASRAVRAEATRVHLPTGTAVTVLPEPEQSGPTRRPGFRQDITAYRRALPHGLLRALSRFDVVLVQEYEEPRADLLAWWGRLRGVQVMASFQGGMPPWQAAPVQNLVRGPSLRRLAGLLVGSVQEAERLVSQRAADPARVHRVVNPVDTTVWLPADRGAARSRLGIPPDAFVAAWHGRVDVRRKGLDVLIEGWAGLCSRQPRTDVRLLLVGAGPDQDALRSLLGTPGLRGVEWLAEYAGANDVGERLAACDVWVSASRQEGFAVAPLEAMASGRAVILSDAPGAEDAIGRSGAHGGALVPRGDGVALTVALLDAVRDTGRVNDRGRAARARVEQEFSVNAVSSQLAAAVAAATCRRGQHRRRVSRSAR